MVGNTRQSRDWAFILFIPIVIVIPYVAPHESVATDILIMAIFASGFNILLGYTGLLSFGHASFFGLGAYGTGLLIVKLHFPWWLAFIGGVLVSGGIGGIVMGVLALRRKDVYFALIMLAFSQVFYFLTLQMKELTGGHDGLYGIPVIKLPLSINLSEPAHMYYFVSVLFIMGTYFLRRLLRSPLGRAMQAIRENEDRAIACGFNVQRIKLFSFIISGIFGGLAGALDCINLRMVPLQTFDWVLNAEPIFALIVGGVGTFFGPFVGCVVYILLRELTMRVLLGRWELVMGGILVFFILFFNLGIVGA